MKFSRTKLGQAKLGIIKTGAILMAVVASLAAFASGGQIVDRVVTSVNGHVVLQSDWEQEVAFEALSSGRDPDSFTTSERRAALDRLIDQELLREQVRPSQSVPADQVAARVTEVRKLDPGCATEEGWHAKLQRYGLTQAAVEKRLGDEIQLMKSVEDRLRPSIQIDEHAVETYYHDQLLPQLKKAGSSATPLNEVFGRIKTLLAEKKMNELLTDWLSNLRSGSHINPPETSSGERSP
jgi:hypothetical protein